MCRESFASLLIASSQFENRRYLEYVLECECRAGVEERKYDECVTINDLAFCFQNSDKVKKISYECQEVILFSASFDRSNAPLNQSFNP